MGSRRRQMLLSHSGKAAVDFFVRHILDVARNPPGIAARILDAAAAVAVELIFDFADRFAA
ncbi:MAG: hypothetical protein ACRD4O_00925 [Bryobacteraceae bacterium]